MFRTLPMVQETWVQSQVASIPKTLKMVLDTSLLNTQKYKVCIKGKVEKSRERSSAPPLHLSVVAIEKGAFWLLSTTVANLFTTYYPIKDNQPGQLGFCICKSVSSAEG